VAVFFYFLDLCNLEGRKNCIKTMKSIIIIIGTILTTSILYANQNDKKLTELYNQAKAQYANPEVAREIV